MIALLVGCFAQQANSLEGDATSGAMIYSRSCSSCHDRDVASDDDPDLRDLGGGVVVTCELEELTLATAVADLSDARILATMHAGRCLMVGIVDDPQEGADILAFLRESFG